MICRYIHFIDFQSTYISADTAIIQCITMLAGMAVTIQYTMEAMVGILAAILIMNMEAMADTVVTAGMEAMVGIVIENKRVTSGFSEYIGKLVSFYFRRRNHRCLVFYIF